MNVVGLIPASSRSFFYLKHVCSRRDLDLDLDSFVTVIPDLDSLTQLPTVKINYLYLHLTYPDPRYAVLRSHLRRPSPRQFGTRTSCFS